MKKHLSLTLSIALIVASLLTTGCSATKKSVSDNKAPASLVYKMSAPQGYSYRQTAVTDQVIEMEGQSIPVSTKAVMTFSLNEIEAGKDEILFKVVLDSMNIILATMMDDMVTSPDVKGQSFSMSIKPNGKTGAMVGAEKIKVGNELAGAADLATSFAELFPSFTKTIVAPGETWQSSDTSYTKTLMMDSRSVTSSTNTFTGYVVHNGRNCARIATVVEGRREAKMNNQGMDMIMTMPFKGTETILFDPEEGVIVKHELAMTGSGFLEIVSLGMDAAFSMKMTTILELKK